MISYQSWHRAFISAICICLFFCFSCFLISCKKHDEKKISVDLSDRLPKDSGGTSVSGPPVRIAIAAIISPKETATYYEAMMNYVSRKMGKPIDLVQKKTYDEVNEMLERKELDLAFVCSGPYVQGHRKFGMELLAAPMLYGKPYYQAYFIVHRESPFKDLKDLKGKRFAFTDPDSNTGRLVPAYMLSKMGTSPENYFQETTYTYSHDNSIRAVSKGLVDGASVDGLIWDYYNDRKPEFVRNTRIIFRSPLYGIPPVVVHPATPEAVKETLKNIFIKMHEDAEGKKILAELRIEKFIVPSDSSYDTVRQMQDWIDRSGK